MAYAVETKLWGVHSLPKANEAFTQGQVAYWDTEKVASAGAVMLGVVMLDTGADAAEVRVLLSGTNI